MQETLINIYVSGLTESWEYVSCRCASLAHHAGVKGVGADESDGILQVVVLDSVLIVLEGDDGQRERSDGALAAVGQFHL